MRLVRFSPLQIDQTRVRVEWTVEPPSPIYRQTCFELDYGNALDPRQLPLRFWWTIVLLILHSHWNLLRPCRIALPVALSAGEIEFWLRMLDQERVALEMLRGTSDFERTIEINCDGPIPNAQELPPPVDRWATAFSGGKDSLAQTAILSELTEKPLLVNTCDPMPPLIDHQWPYRTRTLNEITRRRDVELVVVNSTLRRSWPHYEAPHELGYPISLGEMGDPHLMVANTLAVAASRGIRSVTLAMELEVTQLREREEKVFTNAAGFAYNLPLLLAINRLVETFGMSLGSLVVPFNHYQIQSLLRRRYEDLADLQISCFWMRDDTERSCSVCRKCRRVAMILLALGDDPRSLGIDLAKMFAPNHTFRPTGALKGTTRIIAHASRIIKQEEVREYFAPDGWLERVGLRQPSSFKEFRKVIEAFSNSGIDTKSVETTHSRLFQFVPVALREKVKSISLEEWPQVDDTEYAPLETRIRSLAEHLTATL